jgi:hypothetical protein
MHRVVNHEVLRIKNARHMLNVQDWFYRRKLRELTGAELSSSLGLSMVDHIEGESAARRAQPTEQPEDDTKYSESDCIQVGAQTPQRVQIRL